MKNITYKEEKVLTSLRGQNGRVTARFLVEETSLYPTEVSRLLKKLAVRGLVTLEPHGICLTTSGQWPSPNSLDLITETAYKSLKVLNAEDRPPANAEFDQCAATPETTVRRFVYLFARGDLHEKQLLLLGDDDLLSVPVAMSRVARSVQVLDIDKHLLSYVATIAARNGLDIETHKYDVRKALPLSLRGHADVVITDPPYTTAGIDMFLARACQALQNRIGSVCYLSYSPMDLELGDIWHVQRTISRTGFIITDKVPNFNFYRPRDDMAQDVSSALPDDPTYPWFRSCWLRLVVARVPLKANTEIDGDIYGYPESS